MEAVQKAGKGFKMRTPNTKNQTDAKKSGQLTVLPPLPAVKVPYRVSLTTLSHLRKEMAVIYREARGGKLDSQDASRLAFILAAIGKLIEAESFEKRLIALEKGAPPHG